MDARTTPGWITVGTADNLEIAIRASSIVAIRPAPGGGTLIDTAAGTYALAAAADPAKLLLDVCRMEEIANG